MLLTHGFVLVNANRIPLAESRFERVAELGHVQANPRLAAAAAWGRALVAMRRDDLEATLRWVATAENTALGEADDLLGLPFLCDVATGLGALGELDLADVYLARARERTTVYPDQLRLAAFVLEARRGVVGDLAAQLAVTPPAECWRVNLVCALAAARTPATSPRRGACATRPSATSARSVSPICARSASSVPSTAWPSG